MSLIMFILALLRFFMSGDADHDGMLGMLPSWYMMAGTGVLLIPIDGALSGMGKKNDINSN